MKITKKKLLLIIENYLKESLGDPVKPLIDPKVKKEIERVIEKEKANIADIESGYDDEYNEKARMVLDNVDFIYNEAIEKFEKKKSPLTEKQKEALKQYLENIRVVLLKTIPPDNSVAAAAGLGWVMSKDEEGDREVQGAPASIDISDIKDDNVLAGKKFLEEHRKKPKQNPIIFITSDKHRDFFVNITEKDIADVIVHELDHIKYGMLYLYNKKFNIAEIEKVIRRDLIGKTEDAVADILSKEGLFPDESVIAIKRRIYPMIKHYQNIFGNKKSIESGNYEEFAVRINILTRRPEKNEIINQINNNKLSVSDAIRKYGNNIAQIIPFLKKPVVLSDLEEIVKKQPDAKKIKKA